VDKETRVKRLVVLLVAVVAVGACSSNKSAKNTPTTAPPTPTTSSAKPTAWNAAALAQAKQLADKVRGAGIKCDNYAPQDYAAVSADLQKSHIPVPGAMASCTSVGGEDLTFETFADQTSAYQFMGTKIRLVCQSAGTRPALGAFPYVRSVTWFVEPDSQATAEKLAPILGGATTTNQCP